VIPDAHERGLPFELGRCLLVLGAAQHKARQRRDDAASLDEAIATFRGLDAARWQALAAGQQAGSRLTRQQSHADRAGYRRSGGLRAKQF
jgi:hypothetical protein